MVEKWWVADWADRKSFPRPALGLAPRSGYRQFVLPNVALPYETAAHRRRAAPSIEEEANLMQLGVTIAQLNDAKPGLCLPPA